MKLFKKTALLIIVSCILLGCVSKKKIVYFQNDSIDQAKVSNSYSTIFKPDDLLQITISSADINAVKPFNLPAATYSLLSDNVIGQPSQQMYLIDNQGYIEFPVFGRIKVGGLTRIEAIKMFKKKLSPDYVKDPTINIRISNFKVTIIGDVKKPGTYTIPNERITIVEALGLAGDLNISGVRNDVQVTREENGKKIIYNVDLLSKKTYTSPVFYLQQNDFIYVKPNNAKVQSASYNQNTGLFISIASVLISLITIITR